MTFRDTLSKMWDNIQYTLFPRLEHRVGALPPKYKKLAATLELVRIEEFLPCTRFNWGRPAKHKRFIARALVAKIILNIPYTKQLVQILESDAQLRVICGWEEISKIPSASSFSRAFKEFAKAALPDKVHQVLISEMYEGKIIGHLVRDSAPIVAREQPLKKKGSAKERKKEMNERYLREKNGEMSRRQRQLKDQSLDEMIQDLPKNCDIGMKRNSQGYIVTWKGYKLHAAVDDHCIPISVILTAASLNDCEAAIPLAEKSHGLVRNLYDLMDSAYDVREVKEHSFSLGHIPIIDKHARSKAQKRDKNSEQKRRRILNAYTAEDRRYKERFSKERFNGLFKDFYGGRNIYYKGAEKVFCHIMFGVLALTASTFLRLLE